MASIRIENLTKRYAHGSGNALDGIDLAIKNGECVALLGPSGCGKTTTLQLLAGFLRPDAGEIRLDGREIAGPKRFVPAEKRGVALVFQSYAVWPHLSVFANVAFGLELRKLPRAEIEKRTRAALSIVQLEALRDRYPSELSGGQQQRVALARAIAVEPSILLLDEPLSNLDAQLREEMRFEIRRIHDRTGMTTVYVTHDQAEAMVIADRIAVMNAGKIEQVGTPPEIYDHPQNSWVAAFVGRTNTLPAAHVDDRSVACAGARIETTEASALPVGASGFLCVRPERIELGASNGKPSAGANTLRGTVVRETYLGERRDYLVQIDDSDVTIRAIRTSVESHPPGSVVDVTLPPEACHIVDR